MDIRHESKRIALCLLIANNNEPAALTEDERKQGYTDFNLFAQAYTKAGGELPGYTAAIEALLRAVLHIKTDEEEAADDEQARCTSLPMLDDDDEEWIERR